MTTMKEYVTCEACKAMRPDMSRVTHAATTIPFTPRCGARITEGATTAFEEHVTCEACKASVALRDKVIVILRQEKIVDSQWEQMTDDQLCEVLVSLLKMRRAEINQLGDRIFRMNELSKQITELSES